MVTCYPFRIADDRRGSTGRSGHPVSDDRSCLPLPRPLTEMNDDPEICASNRAPWVNMYL